MTDLATLVESLKREVAIPGQFEAEYPGVDDEALEATLADAFGEAQLQGFFLDLSLPAEPPYLTSQDLSAAGSALVVIFAGMRLLRHKLRAASQSQRFKAGPVEYQTASMTSVIKDELASLRSRLDDLILQGRRSGRSVQVSDTYATRICNGQVTSYAFGGFYPYELRG